MRGHQSLLQARRLGAVPASVWLHDLPAGQQPIRQRFPWPVFGAHAEVDIEATDSPARLDLRFVVGLEVHIHAWSQQRLQALTDRARECGAKRVLGAVLEWRGQAPHCVEMTDTEGALTWHA